MSTGTSPAEQHLSFGTDRASQFLLAGETRGALFRQKDNADAVLARWWQVKTLQGHFLAKKLVWNLDQDTGPVTH